MWRSGVVSLGMTQLLLPVNFFAIAIEDFVSEGEHACVYCQADALQDIMELATDAIDGIEDEEDQREFEEVVAHYREKIPKLADLPVEQWHSTERYILEDAVLDVQADDIVCIGNAASDAWIPVANRVWKPSAHDPRKEYDLLIALSALTFYRGSIEEQVRWEQTQGVLREHGWIKVDDYENYFYEAPQDPNVHVDVPDSVPESWH